MLNLLQTAVATRYAIITIIYPSPRILYFSNMVICMIVFCYQSMGCHTEDRRLLAL
jgi:membrane glycosyltransferase